MKKRGAFKNNLISVKYYISIKIVLKMAKSKYSIVKGKTGKSKKVVVMGKKKVLYKKLGSSAIYVISKKRHIKLSAYKKSKMKGGEGQTGGVKKRKRRTLGGMGGIMDMLNGDNKEGGGKKRKRKRKTKK